MSADDGWLSTLFDHECWDFPPREDDVQRILEQVRLRRRRRLLLSGLAGVVAAGLVAAAAIAVLSDPNGQQDTVANPGPLAEPVLSGPLPEPEVIRISGIEELPALLPGTKVTELDVSRWSEPLAVDESGRVYVQLDDELHELTPSSSVAWSTSQPLAELELSEVIRVAADDETVVWTEVTEDNEVEDALAVTRCLNRATGEVHALEWPQRGPHGLAYAVVPASVTVAAGHIVIEVNKSGGWRSFAAGFDLYAADSCGDPVNLFAERAALPQIIADSLYYTTPEETIVRAQLDAGSQPEVVAGGDADETGPAAGFAVTNDAIVWRLSKSPIEKAQLVAARPDGSHPQLLPADLGLLPPHLTVTGGHMIAGSIFKPGEDGRADDPYEPVLRGLWMYFPSRGAIVIIDTPPAIPGQELHAIPAASGDYLLFTERLSPGGDVERAFVVELL